MTATITVDVHDDCDTCADLRPWSELVASVLRDAGVEAPALVGVYFVDEATIAELNREHLGGVGPTDVLSFPIDTEAPPATAPDPTRVVGDIVVCPTTAERQASGHSGDPHDEIAVLLVHAALHLVGHDHAKADERDRMWRAERQAMAAHWRPLQRDPWAARSAEVVP